MGEWITPVSGEAFAAEIETPPAIAVAKQTAVSVNNFLMFSKVWNCRKPSTTQLSANFTAFQSEHCIGSVTIVFCPIWHPIHRKIGFARIVPAQKYRGPWHQTKKQSCAKK